MANANKSLAEPGRIIQARRPYGLKVQTEPKFVKSRTRAIIAIVDKDPAVRKALLRLLSVLGHDVKGYASAEEFLSAAPTSNAQCLLVDIAPGDMSGLQMVRELQDSGLRCPVIFMTGSGSDAIRAQAKALNCSDYLLKPVSVAELIASIEWATGLSSRIG